ncbi:sigma-70 family RNA polymerase sigma factor [Metallibacterium sp.]|uniref:RNA polymerase sigma factor n=1 Tax=Metallibacterium sp. TaxID=2940281 RepID=UPI0026030551|nr:sigma-70 family RNA polymerase sigma factor [Metallibacterium sp.]
MPTPDPATDPATHSADATAQTIAAIWRIESAKVVAHVARITRDLELAEDCAQDALVAALEHWPELGLPERPGAWLMTAAKRRALDHLRHEKLAEPRHTQLGHELDIQRDIAVREFSEMVDAQLDDDIGDELLRLIFTACHPVLAPEARSALTLRVIGGLSTSEIASAYLKPEPTIAQRIVRAKRSLAAARVPFEVPRGDELHARLASVLEVLYLMFNEGYAASAGPEWMRPALCEEALRLARALAARLPGESEVHGLQALMELQASRLAARADARGDPILLAEQGRGRWDRLLIRRGLAALDRAHSSGAAPGSYALQAAIAACHARAADFAGTDWLRIVALYDALLQVSPSPVVALNRAVAVGMAYGPAAALELVDALRAAPELAGYHLLPAVRGDLLEKMGEGRAARAEFERAADLAGNACERALLQARARKCHTTGASAAPVMSPGR